MSFLINHITIYQEIIAVREYKANSKSLILLVHGAGNANQHALQPICMFLQDKGINCISFDFSGHGESTNNEISSINKKTNQLDSIIKNYEHLFEEITIFAFSMGGQVALNVINRTSSIKNLVLFSPALYCKNSFNLPFGEEFTRLIRVPKSFENNNAKQILTDFKGKVILITAESDLVIPRRVFDIYIEASNPANFTEIVIPNAPHTLGAWLSENICEFHFLYQLMANGQKRCY